MIGDRPARMSRHHIALSCENGSNAASGVTLAGTACAEHDGRE
jgi:hypothetical protein